MTTQEKWYIGVFVAVVMLGGVLYWAFSGPDQSNGETPVAGAAGNLLAEDYVPYVQYNDGYTSQNGITLVGADGDIVVGDDATIADALAVTGAATIGGTATFSGLQTMTGTTTFSAGVRFSKAPFCITTFPTSTNTAVKVTLDATASTSTSPVGFISAYGSCN